jgi:hypothetical protein
MYRPKHLFVFVSFIIGIFIGYNGGKIRGIQEVRSQALDLKYGEEVPCECCFETHFRWKPYVIVGPDYDATNKRRKVTTPCPEL